MNAAIWTLVAGILGISATAVAVCIQSTSSLGARMDAGFARLDAQTVRIDELVREAGGLAGRVAALEAPR